MTTDRSSYRMFKEIERSSIIRRRDMEWGWNLLEASNNMNTSSNMYEVIFHPNSSRGTGAVRGNKPFLRGHIYYWEVEVNGGSYTATDTIIGVGTKDFDLKSSENRYCSLIGSDEKSWGYSYMGVKHHNGKTSTYGLKFNDYRTLIGVRLDMWRGTLEFFHNRHPLGVAFEKLNNEHQLYPMVCSTACQTRFTLKYCRSLPFSLQNLCLQVLDPKKDSSIPPGLLKQVAECWWIPKKPSL